MTLSLIDCIEKWDAMQIINTAMGAVWSEVLAVECPDLDDTKDKIPEWVTHRVFDSSGMRMLNRIAHRMEIREFTE